MTATQAQSSIGGVVFNDANNSGVRDAGEAGIDGVSINIYSPAGQWLGWTNTAADGTYSFNVQPGSYKVCFNLHWAYTGFSQANAGTNDNIDSDAQGPGSPACTADVQVGSSPVNNVFCGMVGNTSGPSCPKDIFTQVSNIVCNNNGTPNDPSDDTFTFTLLVTTNGGNDWGFDVAGQTMLDYGVPIVLGPYPISAGIVFLDVQDHDYNPNTGYPGCLPKHVQATPPAPCSSGPPPPPTVNINCPTNVTVNASGANGATVTYTLPTATTTCAGGASVSLLSGLASGSVFPSGTSTVVYQATNNCGQSTTCSFVVTVNPQTICQTTRTITNSTFPCGSNITGTNYGLWLDGVVPGLNTTLGKTYTLSNGSFVENADGTASFTAVATNNVNSNFTFNVSVQLCGRTFNPPANSPKLPDCFTATPTNWYYYTSMCGTLTGTNGLQGAVLNITPIGPSFQVGTGANLNQNILVRRLGLI